MALDTVAANGLKTVYSLSNRPFSATLKKELEGKLNNLQKRNLPPSTVEPLSPELLKEIKEQDLLVVKTADKSKKFSITTWVFLSLTIVSIVLAILAPMIVLPIAGAFGIITIVFSALYLKSSMDKNKELSNLAYVAFEHLSELSKIQEHKGAGAVKETPFETLSRITGKVNERPNNNSNKNNNSNVNNSNGSNNNSNANNSNARNNNSNANQSNASNNNSNTNQSNNPNNTTRPAEAPPVVNQQPRLIAEAHIMEDALQHALRERCGFTNVSQFNRNHPICQNLLRYFNREPGAALNLNILNPLVQGEADSLNLYNIIDNIFRGVRTYYLGSNIYWNGANWMQTMRNPCNWIELTDSMKIELNTIASVLLSPTNSQIEELKHALVSASCWVIRNTVRLENPNLDEIQVQLLTRIRLDLPNITINPQILQIWAQEVIDAANTIRQANDGNFDRIYHRNGNTVYFI